MRAGNKLPQEVPSQKVFCRMQKHHFPNNDRYHENSKDNGFQLGFMRSPAAGENGNFLNSTKGHMRSEAFWFQHRFPYMGRTPWILLDPMSA
ncbi:hypothetical protein PAAG_12447 [Paracoccidioides lutzii Pb01]|uniref:Uncharacterized protein n=1 Tax=Paracoccidioides lutzii (strain ATCC MYA-826 / Pb01) TaxID=502779 RepID=A0A0A2V060_PARBA|nr:hypothetical protein PAAG_12447 [Paracoccidioides lutzii Pb01]KGQ00903.1 hypothetical protein PAAG_12447 [Paracoccidioides lutzii Pb01]